MKVKVYFIIILMILFGLVFWKWYGSNIFYNNVDSDAKIIEMVDNNKLSIKIDDKIRFSVKLGNIFKSSNNIFKWKSSDTRVASVRNGLITAKNPGITTITAKLGDYSVKTKVLVYDIKNVVIIVGDSRMDHFKDDNNFISTSKYEVKYTDKTSVLSDFDKLYVVSLSGMRYDWLAAEGSYKKKNAAKYVREIIREYEDKTDDTTKYNIKLLFNLGVNDLSHWYLDTTPSNVAMKYLDKLDSLMLDEWNSDIINDISLNIVTLFPINDKQIKCYSSFRYNKDVIEFNDYVVNNSKYTICDAYNDLDFNDSVFRERTDNASCATRDGLHFSKRFNTTELYNYLVNVCANK